MNNKEKWLIPFLEITGEKIVQENTICFAVWESLYFLEFDGHDLLVNFMIRLKENKLET